MSERAVHCSEVEPRLEAWADGLMEAAEAESLARHLAGCSSCEAQARLAARIRDELAALPQFEPPADLSRRLRELPRSESQRKSVTWLPRLAAALLVALGLSTWFATVRGPETDASSTPEVVATGPRTAAPSAELLAAERDMRQALAIVARLSQRAGDDVRRELDPSELVGPALRRLDRSLGFGRTGAIPNSTQPNRTQPNSTKES